MIRALAYLLHRLVGEFWWRRSFRERRLIRRGHARNQMFVARARARDARADALYPPPATGPPADVDAAGRENAPAQHDGP